MAGDTHVKIFIIEDDPAYQKFLNHVTSLNPDHEVRIFKDGKSFLQHLDEQPSIVTLDYSLPDISGEELLKTIKERDPDVHVIIIDTKVGKLIYNCQVNILVHIQICRTTHFRIIPNLVIF